MGLDSVFISVCLYGQVVDLWAVFIYMLKLCVYMLDSAYIHWYASPCSIYQSTGVNQMSNLIKSETVQISPRVSIPASVSRQDAKQLISSLFGNPATAFAAVAKDANHDAFTMRCAALALAKGIYGDSSRLERIESYAATLTGYSKAKDGSIKGAIGKLIIAYRDAVAIGAAVFDKLPSSTNDIDLSLLASSPVFGALIAPPVQRVAIAKPKASAPTESAPTESAPTAASKLHALAIDRNWFDRTLNSCDSAGYFNPMKGAIDFAAAKEAAAKEAAARLPQTLVGMFSQLLKDQPEQAARHLAEMAQIAGYTIRKTSAKVAKAA